MDIVQPAFEVQSLSVRVRNAECAPIKAERPGPQISIVVHGKDAAVEVTAPTIGVDPGQGLGKKEGLYFLL